MKLREIERLRAVAILMVLVVHWDCVQPFLPEIARVPWGGVDLFFVISGYVVSLSLVRLLPDLGAESSFLDAFQLAKSALRAFYVRRLFRIMPPALAVMLATRILAGIFPTQFGTTKEWVIEFFSFFGGVYNYVYPFHAHFRSGVYWSLAVEEHFYLILPILFVAFRTTKRRVVACAGLALFSIACRALPKPDVALESLENYEKFSSHLRFDSLMAGVVVALVASVSGKMAKPVMPRWFMRVVLIPLVIVILGCVTEAAPAYVMHREGFIALWMLSGLLVAYAGMDRGYVLAFPAIARVLEYVGSRSYSLYLVHVLVARLEDAGRAPWPAYARLVPRDVEYPWRRCLVVFAATLVVAEILYRWVEKPCIGLGRRLIDTPDGDRAPSGRFTACAAVGVALFALVYYRHAIMISLGPPNLARGRAVYLSSHLDGRPDAEALTNGRLEPEFGAHTKEEDAPWATIDLGQKTAIGTILVYNRDDCCQEDNIPLEVQISDDDVTYKTIARRELMFTQELPLRIRCREREARFVRIRLQKHAAMCLSEVEIFATQVMAWIP